MFENFKRRLKSKTYKVAILLSVITIIESWLNPISGMLPDQLKPVLVMIWPIAMLILRER